MTRRRDEVLTDDTDEYEVWERKRDASADALHEDDEVQPGRPDVAEAPASEEAPSGWLLGDPTAPHDADEPDEAATTYDVIGTDVADEAPDHPTIHDLSSADPADDADDPIVLDDLPAPPDEPMRVTERDTEPRSPSTFGRLVGATRADEDLPPRHRAGAGTPSARSSSSSSPSDSRPRGHTMRIAFAATEFNYDITSMMLERARAHAEFLGADVSHVIRVPGVYDLPLAVKRLAARDDVDAVVTIGCVIEGETDHDDLVIQHAARKIIDLSLESDKPIGLGITGPGMSRMQAMARIDRAKEAVEAVARLHHDLAKL